ncbi:hypothetical protein H7Y21_01680 [Arenimonas sp.]|nr:hypothetical protein [Candidatus Parcubacteria bacterium]
MSFIDNLKSTLKSLVGKKTDMVVEESKEKMDVPSTPIVVEQTTTPVVEVHEPVQAPIDTPVDNVTVAVEQATADLNTIHTENK